MDSECFHHTEMMFEEKNMFNLIKHYAVHTCIEVQ
jgi:hypothetical protein